MNDDIRLLDWQESEVVVYIVGLGDLHVLSGLGLAIIKLLKQQPANVCEIGNQLNDLINIEQDPNLLNRQLFQLQTLHLVFECK